MARPPRFSADGILDVAAEVARERWRDATVADVAARLGTPAGTIYYRFPSRDALFGSLWLRAIERFHAGLWAVSQHPDPREAALAAAVHVPRFCREHPLDAVAMTLYRQAELVEVVGGDLRERVTHVNDEVQTQLAAMARRLGRGSALGHDLVATACLELPYGLVRRYLRTDIPIPTWLDDAVRAAAEAVIDLEPPGATDDLS